MFGRTLIQTGKIGECGDLFSVLFVTANCSVGKSQCKGRIRVTARAFEVNRAFAISAYACFLISSCALISLSRFSCLCIDHVREIDHRIVRRLQRGRVFAVEILPRSCVLEFCS